MAALEARSVRFAVDYAGDAPKISDACKNFMAYRVAAHATDGKTSKLEADRLARLEILCARACMRARIAFRSQRGERPALASLASRSSQLS